MKHEKNLTKVLLSRECRFNFCWDWTIGIILCPYAIGELFHVNEGMLKLEDVIISILQLRKSEDFNDNEASW